MSLADRLALPRPRTSPLARGVQRVAASRVGAAGFAPVMHHLDAALARLSGGRATSTELFSGLPTVTLTTTGARTGERRQTPLIAVVVDGDVAVIGSNWGRAQHPGWMHNLVANPSATLSYRSVSAPVSAREAHGEEAERIWHQARRLYRGYAEYPARTGGRVIRVFVLEPVPVGD